MRLMSYFWVFHGDASGEMDVYQNRVLATIQCPVDPLLGNVLSGGLLSFV